MTANLIEKDNFDSLLPLPIHSVELTDSSLQWVTEVSLADPEGSLENDLDQADRQWQNFLQAMAIAGFNQWLDEGALPLSVPLSGETISNHAGSEPIANFQVGSYQLYIAAMGAASSDTVRIPLTAAENSVISESSVVAALAHLYILVDVQAEINQVCIVAGLTKEQLLQQLNLSDIQRQETISIPLSHFTVEPEQLLLTLSCLEPVAAAQILRSTVVASAVTSVQEASAAVARNIINAGVWLQNQIDSVAEQMSWALLPPISTAMRPVREPIDTALEVLANQGVQLPLQARGVGGPISLGSCICQVYAWAWAIETLEEDLDETATEPEWALFLLLGAQIGETLPEGIQLQVSEGDELLAQERLSTASSEAYLYTQVQGTQTEQFVVSVVLPDGMAMTLPAFAFNPT